ncbi:MAG: SRPBCC family protein [Bacteroidota bacterium]
MQYEHSTKIYLPIDRVYALLNDHAGMKHWMPGLTAVEPIEGENGHVGSKAILRFQMGKRIMSMEEHVLEANGKDHVVAEYRSPMAVNRVKKTLSANPDGSTEYRMENHFTFRGVMRLMAPLMKGTFKKTSLGYLERFKAYAESQA